MRTFVIGMIGAFLVNYGPILAAKGNRVDRIGYITGILVGIAIATTWGHE